MAGYDFTAAGVAGTFGSSRRGEYPCRTMLDRLRELEREASAALGEVSDPDSLERFRITYLGGKGKVKGAMAWLKDAPGDQKPLLGQGLNALKRSLEAAYQRKRQELGADRKPSRGPMLDVTEPGTPPRLGRAHVITQVMDELIEVFGRMGFDVAEGPEIEDEHHNFIALNIPPEHPARDPLDNFYLDPPEGAGEQASGRSTGAYLLRTQTSTIQIRTMERTRPPLRVIAPGRVYRPDTHDATHFSMFHQIEGLYVDRDVSMSDLKTTLIQFAHAMFGEEAEVRGHRTSVPGSPEGVKLPRTLGPEAPVADGRFPGIPPTYAHASSAKAAASRASGSMPRASAPTRTGRGARARSRNPTTVGFRAPPPVRTTSATPSRGRWSR
jgi:phenylalanyl-tRNA synthetase alpha chain